MRIDSLSDLPPKFQSQAIIQVAAQKGRKIAAEQKKRRKYGNEPVDAGNLHFASKRERRRFEELFVMLQAGVITDLRLQEDFTIQEAFTDLHGKRTRAIRYRADFTYWTIDAAGNLQQRIVEDAKGRRTPQYILKKKLMKDKLGIDIHEV